MTWKVVQNKRVMGRGRNNHQETEDIGWIGLSRCVPGVPEKMRKMQS